MSFKDYAKKNWDGWPLHAIIAAVIMHPFISNSYPILIFCIQVIFWPMREAWQHKGIANIWTAHRIWEFMAPILSAGVMLCILMYWPYYR